MLMGRMTRDAEVRYTQGENSSAVAEIYSGCRSKIQKTR